MHRSFPFPQMHPWWQFHYPGHLKAMRFLKLAFSMSEAKWDRGKGLFKQTLVSRFLFIMTLSSIPNNYIFQSPGLPSLALTGG